MMDDHHDEASLSSPELYREWVLHSHSGSDQLDEELKGVQSQYANK